MKLKKALAALCAAAVAVSAMATTIHAEDDDVAVATTASSDKWPQDQTIRFNLVEEVESINPGSMTFQVRGYAEEGEDIIIEWAHAHNKDSIPFDDGGIGAFLDEDSPQWMWRNATRDFCWDFGDPHGTPITMSIKGTDLNGRSFTKNYTTDDSSLDYSKLLEEYYGHGYFTADDIEDIRSGDYDGLATFGDGECCLVLVYMPFPGNNVAGGEEITVTLTVPHFTENPSTALLNAQIDRGQFLFTIDGGASDDFRVTSLSGTTKGSSRYPMATNLHGRVSFVEYDGPLWGGATEWWDWDGGAIPAWYVANAFDNNTNDWNAWRSYQGFNGFIDTNFFSSVNPGNTTQKDIIEYLSSPGLNGLNRPYHNVTAILNDAIANYNSVSIVFNTATEEIGFGPWQFGQYTNWGPRTNQFMSLSPQIYNRYTADIIDPSQFNITGYTNYDFTSLFSGALVINGQQTMSLSDKNAFDYSSTSLTFNLDTIFNGRTTNPNAIVTPVQGTYIWSMRLATSNLWFWDSMDVVCLNTEAEDIATEADVEGEEEELVDVEEWDWPEENEWEPEEVEPEPEVIVVPDIVVNPTTGNASVALAVIPVALAAAAIVIKKRK